MIDNRLSKTKIQHKFEKFIKKIFYKKISANLLTVLGLIFGILSALIIIISDFFNDSIYLLILASILLTLSFFLDTADGIIARMERATAFGGILDLFCDRTVELSIIIAIITTNRILLWPGILSLAAIVLCITVFLAIGGAVKESDLGESEKLIYYAKGIMERGETFVFLIFSILIPKIRLILLWIFAILVFITALQRLKQGYDLFQ